MEIKHDIPLSSYSTMRLGGPAWFLATVNSHQELLETAQWAKSNDVHMLVIGEGSNILFTDEGFKGFVVVNRIKGFEILEDTTTRTTIRIGAGEHWDDIVARSVEMGLSGIEALSLIPGTAGGTPVQNVGAYGQEIADTLIEVEVLDMHTMQFDRLSKDECHFAYRSSIFKNPRQRRYAIASIVLKLSKASMHPPFYASLQNYFEDNSITDFSPRSIREAVIAIRSSKLPDPKETANTGSFFKNPIIEKKHFEKLKKDIPDIPGFDMPDGRIKVPAGWLLEQAGFKAYRDTSGMGTYDKHALVVVNYGAKTYSDLATFVAHLIDTVYDLFDITLEREPELIEAS